MNLMSPNTVVFEQREPGVWGYQNFTLMRDGASTFKLYIVFDISDADPIGETIVCEVPSLSALSFFIEKFCDGAAPRFTSDVDQQRN